jgi:hypothetical protein
MESHDAAFPPFPHYLEIPSGLPHSHGLDGEVAYLEATAKDQPLTPTEASLPRGVCNGFSRCTQF